ncbi:LPS O-antigen chain length determinant protein WzzB [Pseudomonas sp. MDT2-39-1]
MRENNSGNQSFSEIDLYDLLRGIWIQRWLVLIIAGAVTLASGVYAFLSDPVYEARAYVLPPTQNDIENFNYGRTEQSGMKLYTVKDIYSVFTRNLQSESLRYKFFIDVYIPSLSESDRQRSYDSLYRQFSAELTTTQPNKDFVERFSVAVQSGQAAQVAEWLRLYIDRVGETTKKELIKNQSKEAEVRARNIEKQIAMLRENAAKERNDTVLQLHEAEKVAGAIGLQNHLVVSGSVAGDMSGAVDPRLIYLRGTKALEAEVKNLQARESDDAFIGDLRKLQTQYDFYKGLGVKAEDVAVYQLDGVIKAPDAPIKPRKALILVFGLVLGLMLGVIFGVIRLFWNEREKQSVSR